MFPRSDGISAQTAFIHTMLSYRHAFHAGNHADMLKHFTLFLVLQYFNRKDKPYWYIDTHGGAGLYNLEGSEAQKVGEYRQGIALLRQAQNLPAELSDFAAHIQKILPSPELYCGSPWLAQSLIRIGDKLRLFELHPADFVHLQNNMGEAGLGKRGQVLREDGYKGLISLLPPPPRRAAVLIDPPYEEKQDYRRVTETLKAALKRFESGCYLIWYPCLSREESRKLPEELKKLLPDNYLYAELHVHAPKTDGFGMHGSGMFVINPPYLLAEQLAANLPALTRLLAQDEGALPFGQQNPLTPMPSEPFRRHLPSNKQNRAIHTPYRPVLHKTSIQKSEHAFHYTHGTNHTVQQHQTTGSRTHTLTDCVMLIGTFFTFQSQLLRNIFTLTAVLRQFRTANSRFGTVTTSLDYGRIVADSIVGYRIFRSAGSKQNGTHSNNGNIFQVFHTCPIISK